MDLGVMYSKQENPSFSPQNQSNLTFDFDQRISLSLLGKVGTRLQVNANYDTQSTFDFQNIVKLEYDPSIPGLGDLSDLNDLKDKRSVGGGEDSILKKLEVGNVSMPLNSSLISGAQSLFGVKTELQFGKTRITGVFSEQQSETRTVVAQGGGTLEDFEFFGLDYDENRHFFLGHYFRESYDDALENYPFIMSKVQITRVEVWVTNRTNRTENIRNIIALQDLGEASRIGLSPIPSGFVNEGPNTPPNNENNDFDPAEIGKAGSQLSNAIRDIATAQAGFLSPITLLTLEFDSGCYLLFKESQFIQQSYYFDLF